MFEWAVVRIVSRRVAGRRASSRPGAAASVIEHVQVEACEVLSVLAWAGARDVAAAQHALDAAVRVLGAAAPWRVLARGTVDERRFDAALDALDRAAPALKGRLLEACAAAAAADGIVAPDEGEVVRVVAASLGVPLPPLVGTATAAPQAAGAA
jgi:hypothetical protein